MDYLEYKNCLAHSGVKGQKWGTRRWQNADGSLTAEGRIHYGVGDPRAYSGKGGFSKLGAMTKDRINFKKNYTSAKASDTVRAVGKAYDTVGNAIGTGARAEGQKYRTAAEVFGTSAEGIAKGIVPTVKRGYLSKDARAIRKDTRQEVRGEVKELRNNVKDLNKLGRIVALSVEVNVFLILLYLDVLFEDNNLTNLKNSPEQEENKAMIECTIDKINSLQIAS